MKKCIFSVLALFYSINVYATNGYHAVVDQAGSPDSYGTITAALDGAPTSSEDPYVIFVRKGQYYERLLIDKANVILIGEDRDQTLISYGAYGGQQVTGSDEARGTFRTATVTVRATDFHAENLSIENSFDFLANDARPAGHPDKVRGTQAVALAIEGAADRSSFHRVRLSGYQDTLYVNVGRSYFLDSVIEGNVDFIFGAGRVLFEHSDIVTRARGRTMETTGYLTAPSTDINSPFGMVFLNCRLLKEPGVPTGSTALGRPWHPTTSFPDGRYADPDAIGASVFINTYMDDHIARDGWASMRGTSRDGTKNTVFMPESSRFFEFNNRGPGAIVNEQRRQLSERQVENYTRVNILGDWTPLFDSRQEQDLPQTGRR